MTFDEELEQARLRNQSRRGRRVGYVPAPQRQKHEPEIRAATRHTKTIDVLCGELGLRRKGFRKAIKAAFAWPEVPAGLSDEELDNLPNPPISTAPWDDIECDLHFTPDAFTIIGDEIHCYEVIDTCQLNKSRREKYADGWFALDAWHINLRLWVCDVYGNRAEQSMLDWWVADVLPEMRKEAEQDGVPG